VREEAERPEAIVDGDDDRALRGELPGVIVVALAEPETAAVNPDED
jgi:hypothetical protein